MVSQIHDVFSYKLPFLTFLVAEREKKKGKVLERAEHNERQVVVFPPAGRKKNFD